MVPYKGDIQLKYIKHFKVIMVHKWVVMIECFKRGLYWQGIMHDWSKLHPVEFFESAKYFQGNTTPVNAIKKEKGHSIAWLNHKGRNKHHWQYWVDWYDGELRPVKMPKKYLDEMVCDLIGASKAYLKGKYDCREPLNYFVKNSPMWVMCDEDKAYVRNALRPWELCKVKK